MLIKFVHQLKEFTFCTATNMLESIDKTVPLYNASNDLRIAAVNAKVTALRQQNNQFDPINTFGANQNG